MPLYTLFCLVKPALNRQELATVIRKSCSVVLDAEGVITKVTYNGVTELAYAIKKIQGHFNEANIWQLQFHAAPLALPELRHTLATDERVLRYQVTKSRDTAKVKQWRIFRRFAEPLDRDLTVQCLQERCHPGDSGSAGGEGGSGVGGSFWEGDSSSGGAECNSGDANRVGDSFDSDYDEHFRN